MQLSIQHTPGCPWWNDPFRKFTQTKAQDNFKAQNNFKAQDNFKAQGDRTVPPTPVSQCFSNIPPPFTSPPFIQ